MPQRWIGPFREGENIVGSLDRNGVSLSLDFTQPAAPVTGDEPAGMTTGQFSISDAEGVYGNEYKINILSLPDSGSSEPGAFDVLVNGAGPFRLDLDAELGERPLVALSGQTNAIRVRMRNRNNLVGPWSPEVVASAPTTGTGEVVITANRTSGVAPFGCMVKSYAFGLGVWYPHKDVRYTNAWGDPSATFSRLRADWPWGREKNTSTGFVSGHVYEEGSWTLTVTASDGVNTVSGTQGFTSSNADAAFPGLKTIHFDSAGIWPDSPTGSRKVSTVADLISFGGGLDRRVLIQAGEEIDLNALYGFSNPAIGNNAGNFYILKHGAGANPKILRRSLKVRSSGDHAYQGIDFEGLYDPTDPASDPELWGSGFQTDGPANSITIDDCKFIGYEINMDFHTDQQNIVASNFECTRWGSYGTLIGDGGWVCFIGGIGAQEPGAVNKGGTKSDKYVDHGFCRVSRPINPVCIHMIDGYVTCDWSTNSNRGHQPFLRWKNGGGAARGSNIALYFGRCMIESYYGIKQHKAWVSVGNTYAILEDLAFITVGAPTYALAMSMPGVSLRNLMIYQSDVPEESSTGTRNVFAMSYNNSWPCDAELAPEINNVTVADARSGDNVGWMGLLRNITETEDGITMNPFSTFAGVRNHIYYSPGGSSSSEDTEDEPLSTTTEFDTRYLGKNEFGVNYPPADNIDVTYANAPVPFLRPEAGSPAIGSATDPWPWDAEGASRISQPDRGWLVRE